MKKFIFKGEFEFEVEDKDYEEALDKVNGKLVLHNLDFEIEEEA